MKLFTVVLTLMLAGCYALSNPQGAVQPVKVIDLRSQTYKSTCAGAVEDWPSCYDKASATCKGKYDVITREDNNSGTKRDLTFQCKK